jgi:hypothetical protein
VHFDPRHGKILELRYAMDLIELCTELVDFIDNVDYATGAIFSSTGCDSLYTNLAGSSSEYIVRLFGILKFVTHSCNNDMRISCRPVSKSILSTRYRCIQMLIHRCPHCQVLSAGSDVVMDYCCMNNQLPFACYCERCVANAANV